MRYTIRHVTRFAYETPISESVMEVRMQPRSDGVQRCLHFGVTTNPATRVLMYQDHSGNIVHHFDIPGVHEHLTITAESMVECEEPHELPHRLGPRAWAELDHLATSGELWEYLAPSTFARQTPLLDALAHELRLQRGNDPLVTIRRLMGDVYTRFEYRQRTTRVDSPIDDALTMKAGVCQDFSHIFIGLARSLGVPARYVSGYLYRDADRQERSADGATHAWAELYPTNNLLTGARHIRVAVGRDYADVPPTRGVYKGDTEVKSELLVGVDVGSVKGPLAADDVPFTPWMSRVAGAPVAAAAAQRQQQQQQQQ
jgi:transglutaminase-like putative cysteine protease